MDALDNIRSMLMESVDSSDSFNKRVKNVADDLMNDIQAQTEKASIDSSNNAVGISAGIGPGTMAEVKKLSAELIPEANKAILKSKNFNDSASLKKAAKVKAKMLNLMKRMDDSRSYHMESGSDVPEVPRTFIYIAGFFFCLAIINTIFLAPKIVDDIRELYDKGMKNAKSNWQDLKYVLLRLGVKLGVIVLPLVLGGLSLAFQYIRVEDEHNLYIIEKQREAIKKIADDTKKTLGMYEREDAIKDLMKFQNLTREEAEERLKFSPFFFD